MVWTGQIEPEFSEPYVFYLMADDSATLWLNDHAGNPVVIGQMKLDAGKKVNLRLEYVE